MDDLQQAIEDAFQLDELQKHPGWVIYTRYLREWLEQHEARLMSGHIDDLQEYKLVAGRTDGIRQALQIPEAAQKKVDVLRSAENQEWVDEFVPEPEYAPPTQETSV